ncbi:hypothetical protein SAMN04487830_10137 [Pseudobutyrivibrio sp. OR37]|uniref:hypothetical protein n=1 Tax=Pseudobutyrivibrio sp. OR37 TaxID=1798186 RepID=UPI0008EC227B|nr:hypothetical protein [Pseudobutyrivibrio sp. OR37]SFH52209.1 hypothetical protein SAMN04487830_10137 [Pseudobutyrivibrio sp. OR37]
MQISFDLGTMKLNNESKSGQYVSNQLTDVVRRLKEQSTMANKEDDPKMMEKIQAKIKSGKKLTSREESYLKQHNQELYMQYLRIRRMAEALEHQLENANSKEEVNDIIFHAMNGISDKDPYKAAIVAAMDEVIKEFKKSDGYKNLPENEEKIEEGRKAGANKVKEKSKEEDDFDAMAWTPLQEVIDAMPVFNMQS